MNINRKTKESKKLKFEILNVVHVFFMVLRKNFT